MHISPKSQYDVVIIGAGVGGLTAASLLSKAGYSVCVLEKEPHAGGYLAGFRRHNFRFDTAIHWLNQCAQNGVVEKIFSILGSDHPQAVPQKRIRRYLGLNHNYLLTQNPDELKKEWIKEFPKEKAGIEKFFKAAKKIGAAFDNYSSVFRTEESMGYWERLKNKWPLIKFGMAFVPYLGFSGKEGLRKGLNKFFKEDKLAEVFACDDELIGCLVPIGWAYYKDFQSPPKGGGQVIPEWLQYIVSYYNNDLFFKCNVKQILLDQNTARGVQFSCNGKQYEIESKYTIAAVDVETLYNKMLPKETISSKMKEKLGEAEIYDSSITLSIALNCSAESLGFSEELIHISTKKVQVDQDSDAGVFLSEISIIAPSLRDHSLAPEGNGTLTIYAPARMHYKNNWCTTKDADGNYIRTDSYKQLKTEIAEAILNHVEKSVAPNLRSHILFYDVATPITHWRYTGNKNGTMMGAKPSRKNMKSKVAHYQTPVKNLLIGGQWAELGGGVPIAVKAGANAALLILQKENKPAFKVLADYMDGKTSVADVAASQVFKEYNNSWVRKPTPAEKAMQKKM